MYGRIEIEEKEISLPNRLKKKPEATLTYGGRQMHILLRIIVVGYLLGIAVVLYAFDSHRNLGYLAGVFLPIISFILICGSRME